MDVVDIHLVEVEALLLDQIPVQAGIVQMELLLNKMVLVQPSKAMGMAPVPDEADTQMETAMVINVMAVMDIQTVKIIF